MKLVDLPSSMTDWSTVPSSEHPGESGRATVRSRQFGEIQLRMVEYSASYVGDHWCHKGHLTFVVAGPEICSCGKTLASSNPGFWIEHFRGGKDNRWFCLW